MTRFIDPVVVREKLARQDERSRRAQKASAALRALAWFAEYAYLDRKGGTTHAKGMSDALTMTPGPLLVAGSTPHVEGAAAYVKAAYQEAREGIMLRAIEMAQADADAAEEKAP